MAEEGQAQVRAGRSVLNHLPMAVGPQDSLAAGEERTWADLTSLETLARQMPATHCGHPLS